MHYDKMLQGHCTNSSVTYHMYAVTATVTTDSHAVISLVSLQAITWGGRIMLMSDISSKKKKLLSINY